MSWILKAVLTHYYLNKAMLDYDDDRYKIYSHNWKLALKPDNFSYAYVIGSKKPRFRFYICNKCKSVMRIRNNCIYEDMFDISFIDKNNNFNFTLYTIKSCNNIVMDNACE